MTWAVSLFVLHGVNYFTYLRGTFDYWMTSVYLVILSIYGILLVYSVNCRARTKKGELQ